MRQPVVGGIRIVTRNVASNDFGEASKSLSRGAFLKGLGAVGIGSVASFGLLIGEEPRAVEAQHTNALTRYTYDNLKVFTDWLTRENAKGFIGEFNWPNERHRGFGDEAWWNDLAQHWYRWAQEAGLWTTMHCVDETQLWGGFWLCSYVSAGTGKSRPISRPKSQAEVYEQYASAGRSKGVFRKGMQVAGAQKWNEQNTNRRPGVHNKDYWYASQETMHYLKSKGTDIIRLPFRWERLQPRLGGALDGAELDHLKACVDRAGKAGIEVILSLQNYAGYWIERRGRPYKLRLGTPGLPEERFYGIWRELSSNFKNTPTVVAYDLMNEPDNRGGMGAGGFGSDERAWEVYSQRCLNVVRGNGDGKLIMVGGMSGPRNWARTHPSKWITDPAGNHMYSTHHYFDTYRRPGTGGGKYEASYANENSYLARRGY